MKRNTLFSGLILLLLPALSWADDAEWTLKIVRQGNRLQSAEWVKGDKRVDALTPELFEKIAGEPKRIHQTKKKDHAAVVIPGFDEEGGIALLRPGETADRLRVTPEPIKIGVGETGVFYLTPAKAIGFLQINFLPYEGKPSPKPLIDTIPLGRYEKSQVTIKFEENRVLVDIDRKRSILVPDVGRKDGGEVLDEELSGAATTLLTDTWKSSDLVAEMAAGRMDLQSWLEKPSRDLENILCDKPRSSVLLVGKAGTNSPDVVRHLAKRIADGSVRPELGGWKIFPVNPAVFGPDGTVGGQDTLNEDWFRALRHQKVLLFLNNLERVTHFGGDSREESIRIPLAMVPYIQSGQVRIVGATSTEGKVEIDTIPDFSRAFESLILPKLNYAEVIALVKTETDRHGGNLNGRIDERNLRLLVALTSRHLSDKPQPDIALEALTELLESTKGKAIDTEAIKAWVSRRSGRASISSGKLREFLKEENFFKAFDKYFIGALDTRRAALEALRQQLILVLDRDDDLTDPDTRASQGLGKIMYLGPSGVGKTFIPELLEKLLAENDIQWLFGSETSYVGFDRAGGSFYRAVKEFPERLVVADEFDKVHGDVSTYFMDILDNGRVPDAGVNRSVDLRGLIILHGNFGSKGALQDDTASEEEQEVSSLLDEFALWYYDKEYTFRKPDAAIVKKYFGDFDKKTQTLASMLGRLQDRLFQVYERAGKSVNSQIMRRVGKFVIVPHFSFAETRELIRRAITAYQSEFAVKTGATLTYAPALVKWLEDESWGEGGNRTFRYGADGFKGPKSTLKAKIAELGSRPGIDKKKFRLNIDPKNTGVIVVEDLK